MFIFLVILIISLFNIIKWKLDNDKNNEIKEDLQKYIKIEEKEEDKIIIDFKSLKEKNPDVVAYLEVPNTSINYVVVKGNDNSYYLDHNFDKEYNIAGWIFVDYRNKGDFTDYNTIIYGHNMRDGSMFGTLKNVLESNWYSNKDNLIITLVTENMIDKYKVFSIYEEEASDYPITTSFSSEIEYLKFIESIKNKSIYNFDTELSKNQNIITLSTCSTNNKYRTILHAIKID